MIDGLVIFELDQEEFLNVVISILKYFYNFNLGVLLIGLVIGSLVVYVVF